MLALEIEGLLVCVAWCGPVSVAHPPTQTKRPADGGASMPAC